MEKQLIKLRKLVESINKKIDEGCLVLDNNNDILQGEKFTFENEELLLSNGRGGVMYLLSKDDGCTIYGHEHYIDEIKEAIIRLKQFKYIDVKHIKSFKRREIKKKFILKD